MILPIPQRPNLPTRCLAAIEVLPFLIGRPLDEIAFGWLDCLRGDLRISYGEVKCDSRLWRVTVILNKRMLIERITQEVGLSSDNMSGLAMLKAVGL